MAKDFNTNIDLHKNSLLNSKLDPQTSLPTTNLYEGRIITHQGQVYIYYNGVWLSEAELAKRAELAEDLVGRPEVYHEEFTFQPTANTDSVRDGLAIVKSIKGNTVVTNQLFGMNFSKLNKGTYDSQVFLPNGNVVYTSSYSPSFFYNYTLTPNFPYIFQKDNKFLVLFTVANYNYSNYMIANDIYLYIWVKLGANANNSSIRLKPLKKGIIGVIDTVETSGSWFQFGTSMIQNGNAVTLQETYSFEISAINVINLTQMFGAGNEPPTVEEFERLYPNLPKEYNAGSLLNLNAKVIKSVGFNAFNGEYAKVLGGMQYHLGGNISSLVFKEHLENEGKVIEIPSDNLYTPSTNGYLVATGSNICIHLQHSGYRDRECEAYTENIVNLPIKAYFPDGMNSIGDIHDEIVWNDVSEHYTAIKRIGLRQYQTGDEDLTNVLTDKTNTIYELAEPIESIVDDYALIEYEVSDFGTEEILSNEPTTPIVAEIQYGFNAVDVIRNNLFNIKKIFKLLLTKLSLTGGAMSGAINMSANPFINAGFEGVEELPTDNNFIGREVFYNGKPAYYNGVAWVDAMGNVIN